MTSDRFSIAPAWLWILFTSGVALLLILDLSLFSRKSPEGSSGSKMTGSKSAILESAAWIAMSLIFNVWFGMWFGKDLGFEFLAGYLIEKSLSIDNLFIIMLIFSSFKIPQQYQRRILFYGVFGAIVLRAIFIFAGAGLLHSFGWLLYVFGAILLITAIGLLRGNNKPSAPENNRIVSWLKRFIPTTEHFSEDRFFVREAGRCKATPIFLALVVIEATDLVFAVDSIPAVFSVTQDAFVAFASNILAILGLRALYSLLAEWVGRLRYLKPGLGLVLGFIGLKMLLGKYVHIPSWASLLVVVVILSIAAIASQVAHARNASSALFTVSRKQRKS